LFRRENAPDQLDIDEWHVCSLHWVAGAVFPDRYRPGQFSI